MKNSFENAPRMERAKEGWIDETTKLKGPLSTFIGKHYDIDTEKRNKSYDMFTELHLSGGSWDSTQAWIKADPSSIKEIRVLYENDKPVQIHGFAKKGDGQGTDVYLSGKALEDFLGTL